jgi:metallo-beta-lactamase family protein
MTWERFARIAYNGDMNVYSPGGSPGPTITFWGAAQSVTGSMHLVEVGGRRILLDCGRTPGPRADVRRRTASFPFHPYEIDAVVLSHAHMDHSGNLPQLVRQGFAGPIFCTPPTRDLVAVMLRDSARFQEEDARVLRILDHEDDGPLPSFASREDVHRTVRHCVPVAYGETREVIPGVSLRFAEAGHILGSAMVALTFHAAGRDHRVTFTGDLGRRGLPLLRDPAPVPEADLLICECTYGGRVHESLERMTDELVEVVKRTMGRGGRVLVPAFSLGRTQIVVSFLEEAMRAGRLPDAPIYVDSPLAADVADVYRGHPECLDEEATRRLAGGEDPLDGSRVCYVRDADESRELAESNEPCVIVAAGGMCEGGRILRHLKRHIDDPRSSVVLVSYQAADSLGRRLLEPRPTVRFHGRNWNLWADVVNLSGFSGHADRNDFLDFLGPLAGRTRHVRLVHGEPEQAEALAAALRQRGFDDVAIPEPGERVCLA